MDDDLKKYEERAERLTRGMKKADMVRHIARRTAEHDRETERVREDSRELREENVALKRENANLRAIRDVVLAVIKRRSGQLTGLTTSQLQLLLQKDSEDLPTVDADESAKSLDPADVLFTILTNVDKLTDELDGVTAYALSEKLDNALADRDELLRRLGLTDRAWAMQGGASYTDVEV